MEMGTLRGAVALGKDEVIGSLEVGKYADFVALPLTDGVRPLALRTELSDEELAPIVYAARQPVAATAPLVVFGDEDQIATAGLEYPQACLVWSGLATGPGSLVNSASV